MKQNETSRMAFICIYDVTVEHDTIQVMGFGRFNMLAPLCGRSPSTSKVASTWGTVKTLVYYLCKESSLVENAQSTV